MYLAHHELESVELLSLLVAVAKQSKCISLNYVFHTMSHQALTVIKKLQSSCCAKQAGDSHQHAGERQAGAEQQD